ncbi:MAG: peptide-binding protein [Endomicrobiales bacterium]|nr:peptide-binding protein [Endomicrobiales bacterium]
MSYSKYIKIISTLLLAILFLQSCGVNNTKKDYSVAKDRKPNTGDAYVSAMLGDATILNPLLSQDSSSGQINSYIFNGLLKYNKDLTIVGDLASSWSVSKSGKEIIFNLRKNVSWHDGKPFTANDVRFTYEKLIDPTVKTPYSADYTLVKKFTVIDPYTIKIEYSKTFAGALESWMMGIIPKHIFENTDININPANRAPIGTGPYIFQNWKTDEKITLKANEKYFEGRPYISKYYFRIIPDQSVQFLELRQNNIDEMSLSPDQWNSYPEFFTNYNKFNYPSFSYVYLGFNLTREPFNNKTIRKALAYAINKKEIIDGVLLGMGTPATGPFVPQHWAFNTKVKDYPYDPSYSLKLLKLLGYTLNPTDGYLWKNNKRFEFGIITNQGNKVRELSAQIIQAQLKKIGIKVNIRIVEWSSFISQFINKKDFDTVLLGWSLSRDPDQFVIWNSKMTGENQYNFVSYNNPEVDKLLNKGRETFNITQRKVIYNKIHEILADDLPYIFLYYPQAMPVIHKRFIGPEVAPAGLGWNSNFWWSPKENQKYKLSGDN